MPRQLELEGHSFLKTPTLKIGLGQRDFNVGRTLVIEMYDTRKNTKRKPPQTRRMEFSRPVLVDAPPHIRNYIDNFINWGMGQSYQGCRMVISLDRVQYSFPRVQYQALIPHLGSNLGTWKDDGRVFTGYRFRDRKTILHYHPKNPWRFVVDFHDLPPVEEQSIAELFQANGIEHTRSEVEIPIDIYPNDPDDLLELYELFMAHSYLPYGRAGHYHYAGPTGLPTGYWRNGKKRSRTRHFNRVYIKTDSQGRKFLRVELQVNKDHEKYGVTRPVEFDQIKIEKLLHFRRFDFSRALKLAGLRCDRCFRKTHRVDPKSPYTKTRDGQVVKARFTDSALNLAHMLSIMNTVERPVNRILAASVTEQMDAYRDTPFFMPRDMASVFPRVP
ncbi:MAG: hypothetical protein IID61_18925 [SAR324 cluster bacterium]|nr:hypothetical protein [SAR324 cluster bacterium]